MTHKARSFQAAALLRLIWVWILMIWSLPCCGAFFMGVERLHLHVGHNTHEYRRISSLAFRLHALELTNDQNDNNNHHHDIGIGIDLGTTFSAVAFLKDGKTPTIIPIPANGRTMPSLVSHSPDGTVCVGKEAADAEPFCNVKRILGTGGKLSKDVANVVPHLKPSLTGKTYKKDTLTNQIHDAEHHPTLLVSPHSNGKDDDSSQTHLIRPEQVSCEILHHLKDVAEQHTGGTVTRAVIGVPASFHDAQREATKRAAELAGIAKVKLLREPEAAALAYGIGKQQLATQDDNDDDADELVLVFDLGGGTFDVSLLQVGGGLTEILSTSGNQHLGGADWDARVADHFRALLARHSSPVTSWSFGDAVSAVLRAAEHTRIFLSNHKRVALALPLSPEAWLDMDVSNVVLEQLKDNSQFQNLSETGTSNGTHVVAQLSRRTMETLCKNELQALLRPVREVAIMGGALLPGDTSPALVEAALEMEEDEMSPLVFDDFYKDDKQTTVEDERLLLQLQEADRKAVKKAQQRGRKRARNVAKQERKYRAEKRKIAPEPTTEGGGTKVRDGIAGRPISRVVLVGGATRMPAVGRLVAALTGIVPQKTVNPDEAVALGCAVHVGVLDGAQDMGTVLNPMQAAILRAVAEQQQQQGTGAFDNDVDDNDFGDFDEVEYIEL